VYQYIVDVVSLRLSPDSPPLLQIPSVHPESDHILRYQYYLRSRTTVEFVPCDAGERTADDLVDNLRRDLALTGFHADRYG
jgi:hypothetical protein